VHRVVIVGGGFAGLAAARALRGAPVEVTLLDRRNFHVFQPLLYQVATGGLSPADIATALRWILRRQKNTRVWLAEVTGFDTARREVLLAAGVVPYDTLILAAGAEPSYFEHDEWAAHAPGLRTLEDATEIRRRVYLAFAAAEREPDPARRAEWLTFVVVGAGPRAWSWRGSSSKSRAACCGRSSAPWTRWLPRSPTSGGCGSRGIRPGCSGSSFT
jgi:NADH dehydrogenase